MSELRKVAEALDGLRVFLNRHGDSDLSVIADARYRILDLIEEVHQLHEQMRDIRLAAEQPSDVAEGRVEG